LVYLAYVKGLLDDKKLFEEKIEAWANGPVVPSLYQWLRENGFNPISEEYFTDVSIEELAKRLEGVTPLLDNVMEEYATLSAFELVALTHNDGAWSRARKGKSPTERSDEEIKDEYILEAYASK
jgi:uncharacterized phage-associated protein